MATAVQFTRSRDKVQTDFHQKTVIDSTIELKSKMILWYHAVLSRLRIDKCAWESLYMVIFVA